MKSAGSTPRSRQPGLPSDAFFLLAPHFFTGEAGFMVCDPISHGRASPQQNRTLQPMATTSPWWVTSLQRASLCPATGTTAGWGWQPPGCSLHGCFGLFSPPEHSPSFLPSQQVCCWALSWLHFPEQPGHAVNAFPHGLPSSLAVCFQWCCSPCAEEDLRSTHSSLSHSRVSRALCCVPTGCLCLGKAWSMDAAQGRKPRTGTAGWGRALRSPCLAHTHVPTPIFMVCD